MATAVLIVTLLMVAASLASWVFSQWLATRTRVSGTALAVGGTGVVLLIGALALVMVAASTGWQRLIPVHDFSPLITPAPVTAAAPAGPVAQSEPSAEPVAAVPARARFTSEAKAEMLAAAGRWWRRSSRFVTPPARGGRYAISPAK